jgi:hypothetical protein
MTASRSKLPHSLELLLRVEMEQAIEQANLGTFDTFVAKKYLIEQVPQIDIAEELGYDRTVITRRLKQIVPRVEYAALRLFGNTHTTAS